MDLLAARHLHQDIAQSASPHEHREGQLFTVRAGVVSVLVNGGCWVMPPACLGWVPPEVSHGAVNHGPMQGLSLYFTESWSHAHMPASVTIVRMTPLLTALLSDITPAGQLDVDVLPFYLRVFADAFCRQTPQTLFLPMPQQPRLQLLATQLMQQPDDTTDLDGWANRIGMSRRTLTRHFQLETGWSLGQWRQQMRLLMALEKLASGHAVTTVALEAGYQSVSAFITVFRRYLGVTPGAWLAQNEPLAGSSTCG